MQQQLRRNMNLVTKPGEPAPNETATPHTPQEHTIYVPTPHPQSARDMISRAAAKRLKGM